MALGAVQREEMPETQQRALKRATILMWVTVAYLVVDTVILFLIKGNSQAMQAAWVQDLLALIPPLAFLIGTRVLSRRASKDHPYGFHQSMDTAHFVSAMALLAFGGFLLGQSVMSLVTAERPGIGLMVIFGLEIWHGWVMIGFMFLGTFPPLILGRMKIGPAKQLHNKVLFTDSKMNKADWLSSLATILGVTGIGLGIWWADAVAAIIISLDILWDGIQNMKASLDSLVDAIPRKLDSREPHPLPARLNRILLDLPWVKEAGCRVREEGQVFHIEAFVVPGDPDSTPIEQLIDAREKCRELDWKILDVVVVPVDELSPLLNTDTRVPADD
ncbi:cation diffusion facilitator family transporter [Corynebacterium halotolerans]|uniref:Cation efflux protein transmembrane domain-containing protein n=1 Tax=Corynebacterium halotolerans YIM 70093 = DSM 44683 TaxID=1121362 RepID=M1NZ53_9CORY|nr:cation diffusion facilitator family transporter [Corynebacterium halotolerans]AGF72800.1 hypothetical protein A605_08990 [Corynebacterium halotolerans YIM 70093 = DSM 44683]